MGNNINTDNNNKEYLWIKEMFPFIQINTNLITDYKGLDDVKYLYDSHMYVYGGKKYSSRKCFFVIFNQKTKNIYKWSLTKNSICFDIKHILPNIIVILHRNEIIITTTTMTRNLSFKFNNIDNITCYSMKNFGLLTYKYNYGSISWYNIIVLNKETFEYSMKYDIKNIIYYDEESSIFRFETTNNIQYYYDCRNMEEYILKTEILEQEPLVIKNGMTYFNAIIYKNIENNEKVQNDIFIKRNIGNLTIICCDGKIAVFKEKLACDSGFFKNILLENPELKEIEILDMKYSVFSEIVKFSYDGVMTNTTDINLMFELYKYASVLEMMKCKEYIINMIKQNRTLNFKLIITYLMDNKHDEIMNKLLDEI